MIECIFTIDYEIYGNGEGSLRELVYEPTEKLAAIFNKWNARFVAFVEAAELEIIEKYNADSVINDVKRQIYNLYRQGYEIGLHLHPQWYNARYENGKWILDLSEYNLCSLSPERIAAIIKRSLHYLRMILNNPDFIPISFRAGNWLFQPAKAVANVLAEIGIRVDSSVFKGGLQHRYGLDYRRALKNGNYWTFSEYVDIFDPEGPLLELPIHTQMVPFWKMFTTKRIGLQRKGSSSAQNGKKTLNRLLDYLRLWYPLKFDFCRMTISELIQMAETVIQEDQKNPNSFRPIVVMGHTKDLIDFETVESFLAYLGRKGIQVSTFKGICHRSLSYA